MLASRLRAATRAAAPRVALAPTSRRLLSSTAQQETSLASALEKVPKPALAAGGLGAAVLLFAAATSGGGKQPEQVIAAKEDKIDPHLEKALAETIHRLDGLEKLVEQEIAGRTEAVQALDKLIAMLEADTKAAAEAAPAAEPKEAEPQQVEVVVVEAPSAEAVVVVDTPKPTQQDQEEAEKLIEAIAQASATNRAFVFIKPHAVTAAVEALTLETLKAQGFTVLADGVITGEEIDEKKLIDTHYYAIASKAVLTSPKDLNVSDKGKAAFQQAFGLTWEDAVAQGKVLNAMEASKELNLDGDALEQLGRTVPKNKVVKFGGGFYCAEMKPGLFVINGFYIQMRQKYTAPGTKIHWYEVAWPRTEKDALSWKDFRDKVLGSTDPSKAAEGSLRRKVYDQWESLGLPAQPDVGDNSLHGSASPFEALAEVNNWQGRALEEDVFGRAALAVAKRSGVEQEEFKQWLSDAQVPAEAGAKPSSVFDALEDRDSEDVLAALDAIAKAVTLAKQPAAAQETK